MIHWGIIGILMISIFQGCILIDSISEESSGGSSWTQDSEEDFKNGTFDNVKINTSGSKVKLQLMEPLEEGINWVQKNLTFSPSERQEHVMASIYGTSKIVLFGGYKWFGNNVTHYNDTWIYDFNLKSWSNVTPVQSPRAREKHAMASIWGTDKVLLFGSRNVGNDTWVFDYSQNTWNNQTPSNSPSARNMAAMATIYGTDKVLLFGGYDGSNLNDTWVYDLSENNWTPITPSVKPSARGGHAMASIYGTKKVLLFGGYNGGAETWIYDYSKDTWAQQTPKNKPSKRDQLALATIYGTKTILLFGGTDGDVPDDNSTWIFDESFNDWINVTNLTNPSPRYDHSMATVYGTGSIVQFGGYLGNSNYTNDTWHFNPIDKKRILNWYQKYPTTKPTPRYDHTMTTLYGTDKILLFGGDDGSILNDTWVYDLSYDNWTMMNPSTSPSTRKEHDMALIFGTNKVLLFGGYNNNELNDTWLYDLHNNTWENKNPHTSPTARRLHSMAFMKDTDKVLLFGGEFPGKSKMDTWIYDLSENNWTQQFPISTPTERRGHGMASL